MFNQILSVFLSGLLVLTGLAQASTTKSVPETVPEPAEEFVFEIPQQRSPWAITLFDKNPQEDQERLWSQTKLMFGMGLGVLGILAILPESFTNWDKSELKEFHKKWWDNVSSGPVMDEDDLFLNYITHPYFGGVYYIVARDSGYNQWNSFIYSFLMSTFYWEYGIEAVAEVPSLQDLIITPVGGWLYGEWAYRQKRSIVANDNLVLGSSALGSTALFLLDPVGMLDGWINGDREKPIVEDLNISLSLTPSFYQPQNFDPDRDYFGLNISFRI